MSGRKASVLISGLALFSMFFGAGNLVFPLILGETTGTQSGIAFWGLLITAVLLPLVGLFATVLYDGNLGRFFGRIGKWPGFLLLLVVQMVVGPFGSIPRLVTLSHAALAPYMPGVGLPLFSVLTVGLVFLLCWRPQKIIDLLGSILTPILILALGLTIGLGIFHHPPAAVVEQSASTTFVQGLKVGYHTLDMLAAFLFATLILKHFRRESEGLEPTVARKQTMHRFLQASVIATTLLGLVYGGLCLISAYYAPQLEAARPEQLIGVLSHAILGPIGGLVSSVIVAMACLTTAISLTAIFANYIRENLSGGRVKHVPALAITLGITAVIANLGFAGIAQLLGPILEVCYPAVVVLSFVNIGYSLYSFKPVKLPVMATLGVAAVSYAVQGLG